MLRASLLGSDRLSGDVDVTVATTGPEGSDLEAAETMFRMTFAYSKRPFPNVCTSRSRPLIHSSLICIWRCVHTCSVKTESGRPRWLRSKVVRHWPNCGPAARSIYYGTLDTNYCLQYMKTKFPRDTFSLAQPGMLAMGGLLVRTAPGTLRSFLLPQLQWPLFDGISRKVLNVVNSIFLPGLQYFNTGEHLQAKLYPGVTNPEQPCLGQP